MSREIEDVMPKVIDSEEDSTPEKRATMLGVIRRIAAILQEERKDEPTQIRP